MLDNSNLPATGFLRVDGILQLIPISKSTWWNWVNDGRAPPPVRLSDNVTAWRTEDIHELIRKLAAPASMDAQVPRLVGPGPRLDGVSLARFRRMTSEERAALVAAWKQKASAMIDAQVPEQRRQGRRFLARVLNWERLGGSAWGSTKRGAKS